MHFFATVRSGTVTYQSNCRSLQAPLTLPIIHAHRQPFCLTCVTYCPLANRWQLLRRDVITRFRSYDASMSLGQSKSARRIAQQRCHRANCAAITLGFASVVMHQTDFDLCQDIRTIFHRRWLPSTFDLVTFWLKEAQAGLMASCYNASNTNGSASISNDDKRTKSQRDCEQIKV